MSDTGTIYFYSHSKDYFELSNFSHHPIVIDGKTYTTNEHYFQSVKFKPSQMIDLDNGKKIEYQEYVRLAKTPALSKQYGSSRAFDVVENWDKVRIEVMKSAVRAKFTQHEQLKQLLLSTGNRKLVENSPTDYFWGCGQNRTGQNMLGKILMEIREELRAIK